MRVQPQSSLIRESGVESRRGGEGARVIIRVVAEAADKEDAHTLDAPSLTGDQPVLKGRVGRWERSPSRDTFAASRSMDLSDTCMSYSYSWHHCSPITGPSLTFVTCWWRRWRMAMVTCNRNNFFLALCVSQKKPNLALGNRLGNFTCSFPTKKKSKSKIFRVVLGVQCSARQLLSTCRERVSITTTTLVLTIPRLPTLYRSTPFQVIFLLLLVRHSAHDGRSSPFPPPNPTQQAASCSLGLR